MTDEKVWAKIQDLINKGYEVSIKRDFELFGGITLRIKLNGSCAEEIIPERYVDKHDKKGDLDEVIVYVLNHLENNFINKQIAELYTKYERGYINELKKIMKEGAGK